MLNKIRANTDTSISIGALLIQTNSQPLELYGNCCASTNDKPSFPALFTRLLAAPHIYCITCCLTILSLQKLFVWSASLLCATILPGLIEDLFLIDSRNTQVLCVYLYQHFLVRMFMLILVQFVTHVVFVRRVWLSITKVFFVTCVSADFILFVSVLLPIHCLCQCYYRYTIYESLCEKGDFDWQYSACLFSHLPSVGTSSDDDSQGEGSTSNCDSLPTDCHLLPIDVFQSAYTGLRVVHHTLSRVILTKV